GQARALVREKRHRLIAWGGVAMFLLLSFLAVVGDRGFLDVYGFNRYLGRLQSQIKIREQENARLRDVMHALKNDPFQVEKVAREELGLVRPDELIFEIRDSPEPRP
ncbi:MAG: FtsB family cell division protein, partial [Candidatus Entotheonellia bacterium]